MNIISWKIKVDKAHLVKYAPFPLVKDGPHLRTFLQSFLQNVDSRVETVLVFLKVDGLKAVIMEEPLGPLLSPSGAETQRVRPAVQRNRHTMEEGNGVNRWGGRMSHVVLNPTVDTDVEKKGSAI